MKVYIVTASINELVNIEAFEPSLTNHECKVLVIDEGDGTVRKRNESLLSDIPHVYYGPSEREEWFKERFGSEYSKYLSVIPENCHAETSFGFLVAYEEQPDFIIELDDDVFPARGHDLVQGHADNLFKSGGVTARSKAKWYNVMENLMLNIDGRVFPRGHPYAQDARTEKYIWSDHDGKCVLNMGLWLGSPDLDALTVLYHGGLNGICNIEGRGCRREKVIISEGTYIAISSMNLAFVPKIIPAFYQLYMNFMGIDRYDDVWSGIFLKKIVDHLGDRISLGETIVTHNRRPRNVFSDLKKELGGMMINEMLWRIIDSLELEGETYWDAFNSFVNGFEREIRGSQIDLLHLKFLEVQSSKIRLWLETIDKLE